MNIKGLALAFLACASFGFAQQFRTANVDPVGSCTTDVVYNTANAKMWGCNNGSFTQINSGGVSSVNTLTGAVVLFAANAQTGTYQALAADFAACKTIPVASGTFTITLVASGSQPPSGQCINIINYGSGTVTVARSGQNINGAASNLTIAAGSASTPTSLYVVSDGTNYVASSGGSGGSGVVGPASSVSGSLPLYSDTTGKLLGNELSLLVTNAGLATETWTWYNSTATTGATTKTNRAGAGQSGAVEYWVRNSDGSTSLANSVSIAVSGTAMQLNAPILALGGNQNGVWDGNFRAGSTTAFCFNSSSNFLIGSGGCDIGIDRDAAGVLGVVNGLATTTAANYRPVKASAYYSGGTTFTASGCSNGTLVGGATAGKFTLGANTCTVIVTMGNTVTAPTGWHCGPNDETTAAIVINQTASNTNTATFNVPSTAGATDIIDFACEGY